MSIAVGMIGVAADARSRPLMRLCAVAVLLASSAVAGGCFLDFEVTDEELVRDLGKKSTRYQQVEDLLSDRTSDRVFPPAIMWSWKSCEAFVGKT